MIPRKAINPVLILGLMLWFCLLCLPWTSLWVCVTPDSCPPLLFIFRRWLRSRNILKTTKDWTWISGEGLARRIPWPPQAKAALLGLCFCHFSVCFSWSYLGSPFASFTPHPLTKAFQLLPSHLRGAPFHQTLSRFWKGLSIFLSHGNPQLTAASPSSSANHCRGIALSPWGWKTSSACPLPCPGTSSVTPC